MSHQVNPDKIFPKDDPTIQQKLVFCHGRVEWKELICRVNLQTCTACYEVWDHQHLEETFHILREAVARYNAIQYCPECGNRMLRWAWWEHLSEKIWYWYCLDCDKVGVEPCIHALPRI